MVKSTSKGREGAPSHAVDSIDCTRMNTTKAKGKERQRPSLPDGFAALSGMHTAATQASSKPIPKPSATSANPVPSGTKPRRSRLPKMSLHSSGQARVRLNGKTFYLGSWGSPEAHAAYGKLVQEWLANDKAPLGPRPAHAAEVTFTVRDLSSQYQAWIDSTQCYHKNGKPTSQRRVAQRALDLFENFAGAVQVRRLNEALMIQWRDRIEVAYPKWVRNSVNATVAHVLRMLAWGRPRNLVPKAVWSDCNSIEKLKKGKCGNRPESKRTKRAVPVEQVDAVAKHCHPQIAAMMRLQLASGMRPGEVCSIRWADINKEGEIDSDGNRNWIYTVDGPKNEHHGYVTRYELGKEAQAILEQFPALPTAFIFSPARAMADRRAAGKQRKLKDGPRRTFNARWHPVCYRQHVVDACSNAKVQRFTPHELRHKALTDVGRKAGLYAACAIANHRSVATTARYLHLSPEDSSSGVAVLDRMMRKA